MIAPTSSAIFRPMAWRHPAFTRIEALVLVGILTAIAGFVVCGIQQIRESAGRMSCSNNLRQIGIASLSYSDAMQRLPPLVDLGDKAVSGQGMVSVFYSLRPFMESIWSLYRSNDSPASNYHGHSSISIEINGKEGKTYTQHGGDVNHAWKVFICPSDSTADNLRDVPMTLPNGSTGYYATGSYAVNGLLPWGIGKFELANRSETILVTERPQVCRTQDGETIYNLWGVGFYSPHMPAFAALAPSGSPESWTTGQFAPVVSPRDEPMRVRFGREDSPPTPPDFEYPFQRIVEGRACDPRLPGSAHRAGLQVGMADGSVRVYSYDTKPEVFWTACHPGPSVGTR